MPENVLFRPWMTGFCRLFGADRRRCVCPPPTTRYHYAMKTRILLVEDDERLAELTAEYLRKNDLEVLVEGHGNTAEARILAERPGSGDSRRHAAGQGRLRDLPCRAPRYAG
jgi:hypothetical protein